jgi:hypothetical protein
MPWDETKCGEELGMGMGERMGHRYISIVVLYGGCVEKLRRNGAQDWRANSAVAPLHLS